MKRFFWLSLALLLLSGFVAANAAVVVDSAGQTHELPDKINQVICSGPGCLRLLSYLQAEALVVAVDDIEKRKVQFEARPYALALPDYKTLPVFGEFRGKDNPELILSLTPAPQVIFKTFAGEMGYDPEELEQKTGIPVIQLVYGNLGGQRPQLYSSLRIMGEALGKKQRAEEVVAFFEEQITDLQQRTQGFSEQEAPSVYVGGIAHSGSAHGFLSTEPSYPPFRFIHARNPLSEGNLGRKLKYASISKEALLAIDPDVLLVDLSTLQLGSNAGGLYELQQDPIYKTLSAVKAGKVYGVLPYNWYSRNFGSVLANAYFIGKLLYPANFSDIEPRTKADEIYRFLVGKPVFTELNQFFSGQAFRPLMVN
jgi:iron complex transport system substrate-binding protein